MSMSQDRLRELRMTSEFMQKVLRPRESEGSRTLDVPDLRRLMLISVALTEALDEIERLRSVFTGLKYDLDKCLEMVKAIRDRGTT